MKILNHDEVPEGLDTQNQLMQLSTGWGIFDFEQIALARKMGYPTPSYCAVYAVEGAELLSKVEVIRVKYRMPENEEIFCGIAGVLTRRDKSRLGLARMLMQEVHRREKAEGIKYSILCTGRNNKAHNLYRSLGYADVYAPPTALIKTSKLTAKSPSDLNLRSANADDASLIQDLHSRIVKDRIGFVERYGNWLKMRFELGFEKPESFQILCDGENPIGYSILNENKGWISSNEVLADCDKAESVLAALETRAKGGWLALRNTFVSDSRDPLRTRGYDFSESPYSTFMAARLDQDTVLENELVESLGIKDPRFVCHSLDWF